MEPTNPKEIEVFKAEIKADLLELLSDFDHQTDVVNRPPGAYAGAAIDAESLRQMVAAQDRTQKHRREIAKRLDDLGAGFTISRLAITADQFETEHAEDPGLYRRVALVPDPP